MENLLNPVIIDGLMTAVISTSLLAVSGLTLWLLPWSDNSIRSIDKTLNPVNLTHEGLPLQRLVMTQTQPG